MSKPQTIRAAIARRAKDRKLTTYQVAKLVEGTISQSQVYRYLSGETDVSTEAADALLVALNLKIVEAEHNDE